MWRFALLLVLAPLTLATNDQVPAKNSSRVDDQLFEDELRMPGATPDKDDDYICTGKKMHDVESYIVQFTADADAGKAHHLMLYGCGEIKDTKTGMWSCEGGGMCVGESKIMFAWAKNAPPTKLPPDVGFRVGGKSGVNYLVLQVHYAHTLQEKDYTALKLTMTQKPQKYVAGIHLMVSGADVIPPHKESTPVDANCKFKAEVPIHPFAYRTHAHALGVVISAYHRTEHNDTWSLLGKGNPQWPQTFYPMSRIHTVKKNDILASRCTYNSMSRNKTTYMGMTAGDEMCNFYIMYYTDAEKAVTYSSCGGRQLGTLEIPPDASDPLPRNILLEEHAMIHGTTETDTTTKTAADWLTSSPTDVPVSTVSTHHQHSSTDSTRKLTPSIYHEINKWPSLKTKLGQVSAVTFDNKGRVVIFHRGDHVWDEDSFNIFHQYEQVDMGPIADDTVLSIDPDSGEIIHQWGRDLFFVPHGLTIDKDDNFWVTDVALHQVFKFDSSGAGPLLTLGQRFEPGSDDRHFCKPSSVAVTSSGEFFVADGYCNNRIIKYSRNGQLITQWGQSTDYGSVVVPPRYALNLPHKLVVIESKGLVCVADRMNGRVQCFHIDNGTFHCQIKLPQFGKYLFSIAYCSALDSLFAVNGPEDSSTESVIGFVVNMTSPELVGEFYPENKFSNPHDIAVSADGSAVYVVEIKPNKVWKLVNELGKKTPTSSPLTTEIYPTTHKGPSVDPITATGIVLALLTIPVILLIFICVLQRFKPQGFNNLKSIPSKNWISGYKISNKNKIRSLLTPQQQGFSPLKMESDGEDNTGSDEEENYVRGQKV